MDRRSFVLAGAAVAAGAGLAWGGRRWVDYPAGVHFPGRAEGHALRDHTQLPPPSERVETDIVILGSGVAGLSAAWKLRKLGHRGALIIDGPQPQGNAAGGRFGDYAYPTGAHYLPLPSPESTHVREMLAELGIIQRDPFAEKPYYDERAILHAPEERLLHQGHWQDGFIPTEGVPAWELAEQRRFFAEVERLRQLRGSDGRRLFVFPTVLSSEDPAWQALDRITLKDWLDQHGYRAPTLHWYLNYCCRDDYGARYDQVSAWAGLHYYCSRWGQAANAGNGAWLTWPGGLSVLADGLQRLAQAEHRAGTAVRVRRAGQGVEVDCFALVDGKPRSYSVRARKAICAMPLYVAARVVEDIGALGFDARQHTPAYAPWLVTSFLMRDFPGEGPGVPLCWDNVVYDEPGLGYVVATHQDIRVTPPEKTVFTSYVALSHQSPKAAREWLVNSTPQAIMELAARDLEAAYGWKFAPCVERAEATVRGHAMAIPRPGFRSNAGLRALRAASGPILFAHADLSGFSVFEEAAWWGIAAAERALA
ncbi:NAD(P)-binding protein [Massilia sp. TS11]|uniref:NAD(P)-binding protein n=1 Tax=Massilia sp. TS11 TaxID=2908003 RepID=UPI001EDAD4DD|nr:NAD(P)-binding protein [Massilia sp. TS11]MCG2585687.1 NAD(P)-binding protein [Massilia sp. TS11]